MAGANFEDHFGPTPKNRVVKLADFELRLHGADTSIQPVRAEQKRDGQARMGRGQFRFQLAQTLEGATKVTLLQHPIAQSFERHLPATIDCPWSVEKDVTVSGLR